MNPVDNLRRLSVIFQRQFEDPSTIEIIFEKLIKLNLVPTPEEYTGNITCAYMNIVDDVIYWAEDEYFDPVKLDEYDDFTWISSFSAKWRIAEQYLGDEEVYKPRDFMS